MPDRNISRARSPARPAPSLPQNSPRQRPPVPPPNYPNNGQRDCSPAPVSSNSQRRLPPRGPSASNLNAPMPPPPPPINNIGPMQQMPISRVTRENNQQPAIQQLDPRDELMRQIRGGQNSLRSVVNTPKEKEVVSDNAIENSLKKRIDIINQANRSSSEDEDSDDEDFEEEWD